MRIPAERARPSETGLDLVGIAEISERLEVARSTVDKWRSRRILPVPDVELASGPVWRWSRVRDWAIRTGRDPRTRPG